MIGPFSGVEYTGLFAEHTGHLNMGVLLVEAKTTVVYLALLMVMAAG